MFLARATGVGEGLCILGSVESRVEKSLKDLSKQWSAKLLIAKKKYYNILLAQNSVVTSLSSAMLTGL